LATPLDDRRRFRRAVAERAGLDVSPGATWALVRIAQYGLDGARAEAALQGVSQERIAEVVGELRSSELLGDDGLTPRGATYAEQLVTARRDLLSEELADPTAERRTEVDALLRALSRELVGERP
jgi:hypothetical protein